MDHLLGLKENVIIGKLIPAGAGLGAYRDLAEKVVPDVEMPSASYEGPAADDGFSGLFSEDFEMPPSHAEQPAD